MSLSPPSTTPIEYTVEYSQMEVDSPLSFSVGVYGKGIERGQQLFPYCWCRDILCRKIEETYTTPTMYEDCRLIPFLLIRDSSFHAGNLNILERIPIILPLESNSYAKKHDGGLSLARNNSTTAYIELPRIYFKFTFMISYVALLLRVLGQNARGYEAGFFIKTCSDAGLYNASLLSKLHNHPFKHILSTSYLKNVNYEKIKFSEHMAKGPQSVLETVDYYYKRPREKGNGYIVELLRTLGKQNESN